MSTKLQSPESNKPQKGIARKKITLVVGARPNFMKVAPVLDALRTIGADRFDTTLVHTGQHYDKNMSDVFFSDLEMPAPDRFLGVGSGTHAEQTSNVMLAMEKLFLESRPDLVMVAGDVNSTLATTLVAAKANIKIAHIESGLRSFDREMPEEINRIVADEFSQFCFVTEQSGLKNLKHEGIAQDRVFFVGNTMIDSVVKYLGKAREHWGSIGKELSAERGAFALITLHRPSNVDFKESLEALVQLLERMSEFTSRIIFPIHPRTRKKLEEFNLLERLESNDAIRLIEPVGYLEFLALQDAAAVILTDSGGVQEETTFLGRPCITLRENTERPVTVELGSNELVGNDHAEVLRLAEIAMKGQWKPSRVPELWDGAAAKRIVEVLLESL